MGNNKIDNSINQYLKNNKLTKKRNFYRNRYARLLITRYVSEFLTILLIQFVGVMVAFSETSSYFVLPFSGIALGLMLTRGLRIWPGILCGSLLSGCFLSFSPQQILIISILYTFLPLIITRCAHKLIGPIAPLDTATITLQYFTLLLVFSLIITLVNTQGSESTFINFSFARFFTESSSLLIFGSFLLVWNSYMPAAIRGKKNSTQDKIFLIAVVGLLLICNVSIFWISTFYWLIALMLSHLAILSLIAKKYLQYGVTLASVLSALTFLILGNNLSQKTLEWLQAAIFGEFIILFLCSVRLSYKYNSRNFLMISSDSNK